MSNVRVRRAPETIMKPIATPAAKATLYASASPF